jgi:hypothetical protein
MIEAIHQELFLFGMLKRTKQKKYELMDVQQAKNE